MLKPLCGSQRTVEILTEMGISDHLPASWEICMQVKKQQLELDIKQWTGSKLGKEYVKTIYCHPVYFTSMQSTYMWNAGLDESQAGVKIARRNVNNLRYADGPIVMAESKEELKSLLMKVKEESGKAGVKLNVQKTKIITSSPIISWQIDGQRNENSGRFYFLRLQNHCRWWLQPWN